MIDVLVVDKVKSTVAARESTEVTVMVEVAELPCKTVILLADKLKLPLELVLDAATVTVTEPLEAAKVASPEYVAVITCAPEVVEENVYVAEPLDSSRAEVSVVPSTTIVSVPVGVAVIELDPGATVMVMTSLAPEVGALLAAESVVVEASRELDEVVGQTLSRLYKSMEPRPLASS